MKVLFSASPIIGHVNPMRVAAGILQDAGHTIAVYTGTAFRDGFEAAGVRFFPLPASVDHSAHDIATMLERRASGPQGTVAGIKALFIDALPAQFAGLENVLATFDADLIVYESAFLGMLPLLLGSPAARPVCAYLGISTSLLPREDGAPFGPGLPPAISPAERAQYKLVAREVDAAITRPLVDYTDQRLVEVGAGKLQAPLFESMTTLADLILQPCVPSFEFLMRDPPDKLHFIGALVPKGSGAMPPELREAKLAGRRVVLVSQGTIANRDLRQLLAPSLQALGNRDDLLIVVTTGGKSIDSIPCVLPANAIAAEFINFEQALPSVDVLVAFGGYGTVTQALSFGVPMVLAGQGEDKPENAARVVWAGAGINLGTDNPTPPQIRAAVDEVLTKPQYRDEAMKLAREFATHDSTRRLTQLLEQSVADRRQSRSQLTLPPRGGPHA